MKLFYDNSGKVKGFYRSADPEIEARGKMGNSKEIIIPLDLQKRIQGGLNYEHLEVKGGQVHEIPDSEKRKLDAERKKKNDQF